MEWWWLLLAAVLIFLFARGGCWGRWNRLGPSRCIALQ